jgi:adenylate kinase family enzyme
MENTHTQNKIVYIMHGVPGSGKSTVAKTLAKEEGSIHSTDQYFYKNDSYCFDSSKLKEFHDKNFLAFVRVCLME